MAAIAGEQALLDEHPEHLARVAALIGAGAR
jgi:hypothetical protein